jgi:hypothetical protein
LNGCPFFSPPFFSDSILSEENLFLVVESGGFREFVDIGEWIELNSIGSRGAVTSGLGHL